MDAIWSWSLPVSMLLYSHPPCLAPVQFHLYCSLVDPGGSAPHCFPPFPWVPDGPCGVSPPSFCHMSVQNVFIASTCSLVSSIFLLLLPKISGPFFWKASVVSVMWGFVLGSQFLNLPLLLGCSRGWVLTAQTLNLLLCVYVYCFTAICLSQ